jgi:uncharacterized protein (TIGR04255 family)
MEAFPSYGNSPITEAIIEFRIAQPSTIDSDILQNLVEKEKDLYGKINPIYYHEGKIDFKLEGGTSLSSSDSKLIGYRCSQDNGTRLFQAKINALILNQLCPYTGWDSFFSEAKRLWFSYRNIIKPERIERISLRYINRLDLPLPLKEFKEYLSAAPEVPLGLPQALSKYFVRLEIPMDDIQGMLLLTQALQFPPPMPDHASIILDLDLIRWAPPEEDEQLWKLFDVLRKRKNEAFEACITNKMRELMR